jgi:hypothetical protein
MKKMFVVMMTIGVMLSGITAAWSTTVTINPTDDTHIGTDSDYPVIAGINFGSNYVLRVGDITNWGGGTWSYDYRSLLKFDLSSIPNGAQIISATLSLQITQSSEQNTYVQVHRMADDTWSEGTITWNLAPPSFTTAFVSNLLDTQLVQGVVGGYITWNILDSNPWDWSQDLADNGVTFLLKKATTNESEAFFSSVEGVVDPPIILTIIYNPVPLPPSALFLGTGLAGLLGLRGWRRRRA